MDDAVVITGIGMVTAVGETREATWRAVCNGESGVTPLDNFPGIQPGRLLGAVVESTPPNCPTQRNVPFALQAASEALADSGLNLLEYDRERLGTSVAVNTGDMPLNEATRVGVPIEASPNQWWKQLLPNTTAYTVGQHFDFCGPRLCNSTACASGTVAILQGTRAIQDGQCDKMLVGGSQAIHPLLAAGFDKMRVLAKGDNPTLACRPFDANRTGFVMGEGAAMMVLERKTDAINRGAQIYAEVSGGAICGDAHHVTDLSTDSTTFTHLLRETLRKSGLHSSDVGYINAHGTGTKQNDIMESRGIRNAFDNSVGDLCVSSTKAVLGHLVNAAGAVETALTVLALRDGFAPPTMNLTTPDPECDLDCIPLIGRKRPFEHAMKTSIAFGGHLAAIALRRYSGANERQAPTTVPLPLAA
ncbi:beta-ketoacyl-[acyl-carrier-protein] synthase family protein [Adhaeretor mobilis]|uniref:3-oxoacyl-[acyl-carrier-protein] synthase 2 n=1 Tax=Adhaeretor mobilis TaxID=1930276 RepID=A0A517MT76_9BACT|nr:beta-ketoacyl-[acyl-carrier-protein] synthase family protein [Adhaeretor mobilis]QDS98090.1 3-oxoacyl-[acyl-carrier-protein] synthase 2 [Adhaeretor mobilis]